MKKHQHFVTLTKEKGSVWWVVETDVEGVATQGRSIDHAKKMAIEALSLWFDCDENKIECEWNIEIPADIIADLDSYSQLANQAAELTQQVQELRRTIARNLSQSGLGFSDVGNLLNVSRQRACELAGESS